MKRHPLLITAVTVPVLVAAYLAYHTLVAAPLPPSKPAASIPADTVHYEAGAPQLGFLEIRPVEQREQPTLDGLPGKIAFDEDHTVRVYAPISGRVMEFGAALGSEVHSGDVLAWIASPEFAQALADSRKADSDLALKHKAVDRASALVQAGVVAQKDLESARADFEQAQAEASRADQRLRQLDPQKKSSDRYALRSPINGRMVERSVNPGMEVRPDATTPLFIITDPARVWVTFELSERDIAKVHEGQMLDMEVDAYPERHFSAKIFFIASILDPLSRRISVRASIDDNDGSLRPEMYARISPLVEGRKQFVVVPNTALISNGIHHYVFVEEIPGTLKRREVALKYEGREHSYIDTGLTAGERIVTRGAVLLNAELGEAG